ncbi:MAG: class I SAM-dependent RNA methyltransferase [Alphaproteobacteria bacterium]
MTTMLELDIVATGRHGDGIGSVNGQTCFVPGAIAGDVVTIATPEPTGKPVTTPLINIVRSSPDRTAPVCTHFPACGGCKVQHITMTAYAAWKKQFVIATLAESGLTPEQIDGPHISPPQSRRRATFAVKRIGKTIHIGFNRAGSHDLINLDMCAVLRPELMALLPGLRACMTDYLGDAPGCDLRVTYLENGCDLVIIGGVEPDRRAREILAACAHALGLVRVSWRKWDRSADELIVQLAPAQIVFRHGTVAFPPGGFLQATLAGENALIDAVADAVGTRAPVTDLFCGIGTFALSLPSRRLTAIDGDGVAAQCLRDAMRARSHVQVISRDLGREPMAAAELEPFQAVIFDPPRDGAKAQAQKLAASNVPVIAAVSCDHVSFCRDGKILTQGGYRLTRLSIVDQFLWSRHVELVGIFRKGR